MINVEPGTYKEGVLIEGSKHDGITIQGTKKNAKKTVLEGKKRQGPGRPAGPGRAQTSRASTAPACSTSPSRTTSPTASTSSAPTSARTRARATATWRRTSSPPSTAPTGSSAFNCIGGRMTKSVGYGQGDSAYYVGATPPQDNPKWTKLDHLDGLRERARLLGHELEVREDHRRQLLQQRRRRGAEHARLRAVRADRDRDHREQQHLLEQLQLLPAELEGQDRLRRPRHGRGS